MNDTAGEKAKPQATVHGIDGQPPRGFSRAAVPANLLYREIGGNPQETRGSMCGPQIALLVLDNRIDSAAGDALHGNEPCIVEVTQSRHGSYPDVAMAVLEQRRRKVDRSPSPRGVNGHSPVLQAA